MAGFPYVSGIKPTGVFQVASACRLRYTAAFSAFVSVASAMSLFLSSLSFALNIMLPNILLLALGWLLKRAGYLNEAFCAEASRTVFLCSLPLLLFLGILQGDADYSAQKALLAAGVASTLLVFVLAELAAARWVKKTEDRGVFVQGVFRGNLAIIGLSLCANAYGSAGLAVAAVFTGVVTILYNILAVITLSRHQGQRPNIGAMLKTILKNPLIIGIVSAIVVQQSGLTVPKPLLSTASYLADLALPLALLCAGATFNAKTLFGAGDISLWASAGRLLFAPLLAVFTGLAFGLEGINMGVLFLMSATPVAAASYVMTRALGGNDTAAANILGFTTFASLFTTSAGIMLMHGLGLM